MINNKKNLYFLLQKGRTPTFPLTRTNVSLSQSAEPSTLTLQSKSQFYQQNVNNFRNEISPRNIIQIDDKILELYDELENNYKILAFTYPIVKQDQQSPIIEKMNDASLKNVSKNTLFNQEELDSDKNNKLVVNRFKFYYFRIKIFQKQSPLQLCFNFSQKITGMKVFLSQTIEFPTSLNADYFIQSKYTTISAENGSTKFLKKYLYASLYSESDSQLKIQLSFGRQLNQVQTKKNKSNILQNQLYEQESPRKLIIHQNDKIQRNINIISNSQQKYQRIFDLQFDILHKQKLVKQSKQFLTEECQFEKIVKIRTRNILKDYRKLERIYKNKVNQAQIINNGWFQLIVLFRLGENLYQFLQEMKRWHRIQNIGKLLAWRYKTVSILWIKSNGKNLKERCLNRSLMCTTIFAKSIKQKVKKQATIVLQSILQQTLPIMTIKQRIIRIRAVALKWQNKFKSLKIQKKLFYDKFWKLINHHFNRILNELQNKKLQTPTIQKEKNKSISLIDTFIMIPLIEQYLLKNKKQWLEYLHYKRIKQFSNISQQFPSQIEKIKILTYTLKEPRLFNLPQTFELKQIIENYAKIKQLI